MRGAEHGGGEAGVPLPHEISCNANVTFKTWGAENNRTSSGRRPRRSRRWARDRVRNLYL